MFKKRKTDGIVINNEDFNKYLMKKKQAKEQMAVKQELKHTKDELTHLHEQLTELKGLLQQLLKEKDV